MDVFDFSGNLNLGLQAGEKLPSLSQLQYGVSVVLVLDNSTSAMLVSIPSILQQHCLRELILVVRMGTPDLLMTLEHMSKEFSFIHILKLPKKASLASAYHAGAQRASSIFLMFVEQGALLPKGITERFITAGLNKGSAPWLVSARLEHERGASNEILLGLLDPKEAAFALLGKKKTSALPGSHVQSERHVPSVRLGCFMIRRKDFWLSDGFDSTCVGEAQLADLCLKVHMQGGGVYELLNARVRLRASIQAKELTEWTHFKGWLAFYSKHYTKSPTGSWLFTLYLLLFARLCLRSIMGIALHLRSMLGNVYNRSAEVRT